MQSLHEFRMVLHSCNVLRFSQVAIQSSPESTCHL